MFQGVQQSSKSLQGNASTSDMQMSLPTYVRDAALDRWAGEGIGEVLGWRKKGDQEIRSEIVEYLLDECDEE